MNPSPPKKEESDVERTNKELKEIDSQMRETFQKVKDSKQKLKIVKESYKYLLDGVNNLKLEEAIKNQVNVLRKYEKMQEEIIKRLNDKVKKNQYVSISKKISEFKERIQKTLGKDQLLSLLVQLDQEIDNLEKRKSELTKKVDSRANQFSYPS